MRAILIADLGFGDSGKGTTVDHLARREGASAVVRYNGGAQAAHNVVTEEGLHHTFAQFGSGTFAGAKTHLSRCMMINPLIIPTITARGVRPNPRTCRDSFLIDNQTDR